jgi:hypothetical protein
MLAGVIGQFIDLFGGFAVFLLVALRVSEAG